MLNVRDQRVGHSVGALVASLTFAVGLASCSGTSGGSGPDLKAVGDGLAGGRFHVRAHIPYVVPMRSLCTTGGPITVRRVTAAGGLGNVQVVDWGIRKIDAHTVASAIPGAASGTVAQRASDFATRTPVTAPCGAHTKITDQFAVSMAATRADRAASANGVWVYYGPGKRVFAQFTTVLCPTRTCPNPPPSADSGT